MSSRLLIVEDDPTMRGVLGTFFEGEGVACELVADALSALQRVDHDTFDVVLSDVAMEGMSGLELLDRLKRSHPALPVVIVTGRGGVAQAVDAVKRGAFEYLVKPFDGDELRRVLSSALETRRRLRDSVRAPANLSDDAASLLIGSGPAMQRLQTTIDFVARSSAPVLVTGETGAGKELVARAIHARGPRASRAFVAVNTAAIPHELLEGELFGHVRGGFTGALQARKGLLTEADGGTLLLDEIGDMSFDLQAKLLRVLQFGDVRPVGGDRSHHVDVRVIASTHRDLAALVAEGRFRQDLHFRLDVLPVVVPPLREHVEDLPALVAHFLAQASLRTPGSPVRAIGPDALVALSRRTWPGNVRELASFIERAVVFGVDEVIGEAQLAHTETTHASAGWHFAGTFPCTLEHMTQQYVTRVLEQTGGDKRAAASVLDVDLSTLYRWQRKWE